MRKIPVELTRRYEDEGWWTQDTLGDLIARGLQASPDAGFHVHSAVRPFAGTFHDVEIEARRLAAGLRARGVGPGDVVALQLPNWKTRYSCRTTMPPATRPTLSAASCKRRDSTKWRYGKSRLSVP